MTTLHTTMSRSDKHILSWTGSVNINAGAATTSNLAKTFTPKRPMYEPGLEKQQHRVWLDMPKELTAALRDGMAKIGNDCLKANAEIVLDLFQEMIIKHVLQMQIKDKHLGKILRGNPEVEDASNAPPDMDLLAGMVAKSSMLGRDPWGDEPLPTDETKEPEDSFEEAVDASATTTTTTTPKVRVYTEVQAMLKSVQDNTWLYLTTHLKRLLEDDILLQVINEEMRYRADDNNIRTSTARKRMPWKAYRKIVLDLLPEATGLYELMTLMALCRESGESASRWIQRLRIGKRLVQDAKIKLPEKLYVDMAMRYFTSGEIQIMATKIAKPGSQEQLTTSQAKQELSKLSWDKLRKHVDMSVHSNNQRYKTSQHKHLSDTRLFTLEQAKAYLATFKAGGTASSKGAGSGNPQKGNTPKCSKCIKAGLTGRLIRHPTNKCVDSKRLANVKNMNGSKSSKRKREEHRGAKANSDKQAPSHKKPRNKQGQGSEECQTCKSEHRPYRHSEKTCKYAPGGAWHGKSGEQLRALQKKYYDERRNQNASRNQSKQVVQEPSPRKRRREEHDSSTSTTSNDRPLWAKEHTMMVEQHFGPNQHGQTASSKNTTFLTGAGALATENQAFASAQEPLRIPVNEAENSVVGNSAPPGVKLSVTTNRPTPRGTPGSIALGKRKIVESEGKIHGPVGHKASCVSPTSVTKANLTAKSGEPIEEEADHRADRPKGVSFSDQVETINDTLNAYREAYADFDDGDSSSDYEDDSHSTVSAEAREDCRAHKRRANRNKNKSKPETTTQLEPVIDLTGELAEDRSDKHVCHMMSDRPVAPEDLTTEEEDPNDPRIYVTIIPCGPDGEPYKGQQLKYFWYMDQPTWLFLESVREDYPIWDAHYKLILPDNRLIETLDDPRSLGYTNDQHIQVRLAMLHLPNANSGWSISLPGDLKTEAGRLSDEVHKAAVAASISALLEADVATSTKGEAAKERQEVIVLELWLGERKNMTVRWGSNEPMRRLLSALAVILMKPNHHLILTTTAHRIAGKGCIRSIDTPSSLSMPRGGTISMHYLPHKPETSPAFLLSPTEAWRLLKTTGVYVWKDKTKSGERRNRGVGTEGTVHCRRDHSSEIFFTFDVNNNKRISLYKNTFQQVSDLLRNIHQKIRKHKRKPTLTKRLTKTSDEIDLKNKKSSKRKFSSKKKKFPRNLKKRSRVIKLKPDPKITLLSKSDIGELRANSESLSRVRRGLNLTFEPEEPDQEISPSNTEKTGGNTQKVSKNKTNKNYPKSRELRSHVTTSDRTRTLNPSLTAKASIHSGNKTQTSHYVLSPERPDSSVSSTNESENVSAEVSDITEMSETIYHLPDVTRQNIAVKSREFYQNKTVHSPDMRFFFSNEKTGDHHSASLSQSKTKTQIRSEKHDVKRKESKRIPDVINLTNTSGNHPDVQMMKNYSPKSSEDTTDGEGSKYASFVIKRTPSKRKRSKERKKEKSTFSETENYRLLRTYLRVLDINGTIRRVLVALDTQFNVSYTKPKPTLGEPREWRSHENKYVKGISGWSKAETPLLTRIIKQGKVIEIDTRTPPKNLFDKPDGPEMLLGAQHCVTLGIDLNKSISSLKHDDVIPYLSLRPKKSRNSTRTTKCRRDIHIKPAP